MATDLATLGIKIEAGDIKAAVRDLDRLENQGKQTEKATDGLTRGFKALGAVLATIGVVRFAQGIANATMRMQAINSAMRVAANSAEEAADMMDFVRRESDRLGLSVADSAKEFASLAVAAKGTALEGQPARDIFLAIAEASTAMGLSADEASGALNAIQQMISKGTVSAEELRGQLGERLPGAFQAAARAMNMTTEELGDALQAGEVMAEDMLPRLADELRNTFSAQATAQAGGLRAEINRMSNNFNDLMAQDNLPAATEALRNLNEILSDEGFQESFDTFVSGIAKAVEWGTKGAVALIDFAKAMGEIAAGASGFGEEYDALTMMIEERQDLISKHEKMLWGTFDKEGKEAINARIAKLQEEIATYEEMRRAVIFGGDAPQKASEQGAAIATAAITSAKAVLEQQGGALAAIIGGGSGTASGGGEDDEEAEAHREKLQARLDRLREHYATETELALMNWQERKALIDELEAEKLVEEEEARALRLEAEQEYQDRMTQIEEDAAKARASVKEEEEKAKTSLIDKYGSYGVKLMQQFGIESFNANKIIGAAQAFISTLQGQAEALKLPFPANLAAAAKVGAVGFGLVSAIKSAGVGGGGGGGSIGGGFSVPSAQTATAEQAPQPVEDTQPQRIVNIAIDEGAIVDGRKIIELMDDAIGDGVTLNAVVQ